jgi:metal-responsive CopG/Arc/MetJ family transcriptional regulator
LDDDLVARLDHLASERGTSRSDLLRHGALAVLEAAELHQSDTELRAAYRRIPQDPRLIESAATLAADTVPEW